jgi:hypothetical protein
MNARKLVRATLACLCTLVGFLGLASAPALAHYEYVAGGKFGSEGSGKGQFAEPIGVAVNESTEPVSGAGDVYVADRANGRVERFSATGSYLGQFDGTGNFEVEGKAEKGAAAPAGQLLTPEWIAVDNSGTCTSLTPGTRSSTSSAQPANISRSSPHTAPAKNSARCWVLRSIAPGMSWSMTTNPATNRRARRSAIAGLTSVNGTYPSLHDRNLMVWPSIRAKFSTPSRPMNRENPNSSSGRRKEDIPSRRA